MEQIRNIAFDLGGVVLALSLEGAIRTFEKMGVSDARQRLDAFQQKGVFADLEAGRISMEEFRIEMCHLTLRCKTVSMLGTGMSIMSLSRTSTPFSVCDRRDIRCACFLTQTPS